MHSLLTLNTVSTTNAGNYAVVITSPYGSVTSAVATLTVVYPPSILVQPASQAVLVGSNATLSVTASGTAPLYYLWYDNATNSLQVGTDAALTLPGVSLNNSGSYTVIVVNAYGAVTSSVAVLSVGFAPSIASQPTNQTVVPGLNVTFNATVAGTGPFTYQWQFDGSNLPTNIITTVAGNGSATYAGDGGAATFASLRNPSDVALDASGNLYIATPLNERIRKVDTNGIITTVAGNGNNAFSGDGGVATNASLSDPAGVVLDESGNLYIADIVNRRVRRVDTNGIITTVAGNGTNGYSGDGGAATNASLADPFGVAVDAVGNLYIADLNNYRIRKVNTNGIITTVAGNGTNGYSGDGGAATNASLSNPTGMTTDASGNLYIADEDNQRIRKVDTNGFIITVVGNGTYGFFGDGGAATNASLHYPFGVALDAVGNLYVADYGNNRIRKVLPPAGPILPLTLVSAINAGNYTVVITSPYGSVTSAVATLTVQAPPVITVHPQSQIVGAGSNAIFSVTIAGSGPFGYFWYLASTNLIQSSTSSTLTVAGVSTNDSGNYSVEVTNAYGSVTSQIATLTIALPPSLTTPPASQTVFAGTNLSFSVTAGGIGPFS